MARLTATRVVHARAGRHGDGDGLYLLVKPSGGRSWLLRVQQDGKRRDIGLGSAETRPRGPDERRASDEIPLLSRSILTLQEAREKAAELRRFAKAGRDPKVERDRDRRKVPTFEAATEDCHRDLKSRWSERQAATFLSSLKRHAHPHLGKMPVDQIDAGHVRDMLAPIWSQFTDMSVKVRSRVSTVLNYAHNRGWRPLEAPAARLVAMGLGKPAASGNLAAMPYPSVPTFTAALSEKVDTAGRLALLFTILTAARSGETRHARWSHIDMVEKLWHRPSELMKMREAHSVTLSDAAVVILERAKALNPGKPDELIFPSMKGKPLSDMTLSKIMRDDKQPYTVHGFRSSFRDWAAEMMSEIPDPVAEAALAHAVPDKVERAYKRTTFIEMRRKLLGGWADYLKDRKIGSATSEVTDPTG